MKTEYRYFAYYLGGPEHVMSAGTLLNSRTLEEAEKEAAKTLAPTGIKGDYYVQCHLTNAETGRALSGWEVEQLNKDSANK